MLYHPFSCICRAGVFVHVHVVRFTSAVGFTPHPHLLHHLLQRSCPHAPAFPASRCWVSVIQRKSITSFTEGALCEPPHPSPKKGQYRSIPSSHPHPTAAKLISYSPEKAAPHTTSPSPKDKRLRPHPTYAESWSAPRGSLGYEGSEEGNLTFRKAWCTHHSSRPHLGYPELCLSNDRLARLRCAPQR